jgi:16S rRNA (cytidine1402-2'-O)-methyltransferase
MNPGRLLIGATPLGQPSDASARLVSALARADVIAAEDTRRIRTLAQALEVKPAGKIVSLYDQNEAARVPALVAEIAAGATVLLVSDAGMPLISDPGYRLVSACIDSGLPISCLPGPSAVTTALAVSGLPCDRFCFEGFLPRKAGERRSRLAGLADERRTMVFFESPHRLADALTDAAAAFGGDRDAAVCRELTKTHEEIRRGPLASLAEWAADGVRGEITLVVAGAVPAPVELGAAELAAAVAAEEAAGATRKDAIRAVVVRTGLPRRTVYDAVVAAKSP